MSSRVVIISDVRCRHRRRLVGLVPCPPGDLFRAAPEITQTGPGLAGPRNSSVLKGIIKETYKEFGTGQILIFLPSWTGRILYLSECNKCLLPVHLDDHALNDFCLKNQLILTFSLFYDLDVHVGFEESHVLNVALAAAKRLIMNCASIKPMFFFFFNMCSWRT